MSERLGDLWERIFEWLFVSIDAVSFITERDNRNFCGLLLLYCGSDQN